MRRILSVAVLAAALGGTSQAQAPAVRLTCHVEAPAAQALCDALRGQLQRRGHEVTNSAKTELALEAHLDRPGVLRARLSVIRGQTTFPGQQGQLSVMDRDRIPPRQLEDFAAALIDRAQPDL